MFVIERFLTLTRKLEHYFIPTAILEDKNFAWRVRTLLVLTWIIFLIALIYTPLWLIVNPQFSSRIVFSLSIFLLACFTMLLIHNNRIQFASLTFLSGLWFIATIVSVTAGGVRAPIFGLYIPIVIFAGLLQGWRVASVFWVLSVGAGITMYVTENMGLIAPSITNPASALLTQSTILIIVIGATFLAVYHINQSLKQLQHELAERKKIEEGLRINEERYRLISSVISDYTFSEYFDEQGKLEKMILSDSFEAVTGYTQQEFLAMGAWRAIVHPDDLAKDNRDMGMLRQNQKVISELRIIKKNEAICWVRTYAIPVWDFEKNRLLGINGAVQEINEEKPTETALRESEKRYRIIFSMMSDYAFSCYVRPDGSTPADWATVEPFKRLTGYDWTEIPQDFELYHPDDLKRAEDDVKRVLTGEATAEEYRIITKSGEVRWVYIQQHPVWDETHQRVIRFYGATSDITERKLAEETLRRSEASLRALLDATTDTAFLMDTEGIFLTLNKVLPESRNLTVQGMIGTNAFDSVDPELRKARLAHFQDALNTKKSVRWEDQNENTYWDNSIYPVLSASGEVEAFAVYARDITQEKHLTKELQRYTAQLEQMVEERTIQLRRAKEQIEIILNNTSNAVALAQANGDIETKNPAFIAMFGDQVSQAIERILWTITGDEQSKAVGNALVKVIIDKEFQRLEAQIHSESGIDKDVDLAFIPVKLTQEAEQHGIIVSAHDITPIKQIERFKARFVADAVHDLATPISGLSTRLYLLKRSPERLDEHVSALENQVTHLSNLLEDLRTISQLDREKYVVHLYMDNINPIIMRVFDTYEPIAISKEQSLKLITQPKLPDCYLDNQKIERVLVNLVSNAIRYTPNGREVYIRTSLELNFIVIEITDQGIGMSADEIPHIFDRFYRTNLARMTQSTGTGLGLSIVKEIVELHGGFISVTSELGQGSTFTVRLPVEQ